MDLVPSGARCAQALHVSLTEIDRVSAQGFEARYLHPRAPVARGSRPKNSQSFPARVYEIAAAIGADPVAFRRRYLKEPRDIAVVKAAAERAGWEPRPSPRPDRNGDTLSGRGMAYTQRSGRHRRRGRDRPPHRQGLGAQVHRRA